MKFSDNSAYTFLPYYYDKLNSSVDYDGYADYIDRKLKENNIEKGDLVLDLACGTGAITTRLAKMGYDMTGVDISSEMLEMACRKNPDILWLNQDMREFELYGTVKAVICCLDSINYLLKPVDLNKCFSLVSNYLEPKGIFLFDINSEYKFENIYGDNHYILEDDGVFCGWKNYYNRKSGNCDFDLTFFTIEHGEWVRTDEYQREHFWSIKIIKKKLVENGFAEIEFTSDFSDNPICAESERIFVKAKKQ